MSTEPPARASPARAAAYGLSGGMMLGAIYLGVRAALLTRTECGPGVTGEDCVFEQTLANEMAHFFILFAAGLLCVGVGIYVLFRKKS